MDIHVVHPGGVECVTVAVDATVAELRDAVAECLCLVPGSTVLAHEGGGPLGAGDGTLDVPLCDVLCSDTVQVCPSSAAGVACDMGLRCEDLAVAFCVELEAGRSGGERAQVLLSVLEPSHWELLTEHALIKAIEHCPTPAVLERLLASCGDRILERREVHYWDLARRFRGWEWLCTQPQQPWKLRLCLRAGLLLEDGLLADYKRVVPRDLLEIMIEEAPERCVDAGLLHKAMLERYLALVATPVGALRTAVMRLVEAGCGVDTGLVLAASRLGQVGWLRWLFDEMGCDVDVADADGCTALHVAGSAEVVRLLAARGARPDLRRRGGLSVAHRAAQGPGCHFCGDTYEADYAEYYFWERDDDSWVRAVQRNEAFAEVLATWPWLVHAEDWEGRTALRWIWVMFLGLSQCGGCRRSRDMWDHRPPIRAATGTIERSHVLVTFGADVHATDLTDLQTIGIAVHAVREPGRDALRFEEWKNEASSDSESWWDAAEAQDEAYERLCCRVKRSGRSKRRQTRTHKYRAWVPEV